MLENSASPRSHRLKQLQVELFYSWETHFHAQTLDNVERKSHNPDYLIYTKATAKRFNAS
jgi:hypothetical protein